MNLRQIISDHYGPATAATYDQLAERFFWGYSESLTAVSAEVLYGRRRSLDEPVPLGSVLDVGAGTGNLSRQLLQDRENSWIFSSASGKQRTKTVVCLLDASPSMLEVARAKLSDLVGIEKIETITGEMSKVGSSLHHRKFDCIVSSYAIHHLSPEGKKQLFSDLFSLLVPGGVLVVADRISVSGIVHSRMEIEYLSVMCSKFSAFFSEAGCRATLSGLLDDALRQFAEDQDQPSTAEEQIRWMQEAGFSEVRMPWSSFACCVFSGRRPTLE